MDTIADTWARELSLFGMTIIYLDMDCKVRFNYHKSSIEKKEDLCLNNFLSFFV